MRYPCMRLSFNMSSKQFKATILDALTRSKEGSDSDGKGKQRNQNRGGAKTEERKPRR